MIVEFDFTVLDGSKLLFDTAKALLQKSGVELTPQLEAMHLAGGNYHGGLAELFDKLGKKADAAALARELNATFNAAVAQAAPGAITQGFRNFCKALLEKDVKVVVATRGDAPALGAAINSMSADGVRISYVVSKSRELSRYMQTELDEDWKKNRHDV